MSVAILAQAILAQAVLKAVLKAVVSFRFIPFHSVFISLVSNMSTATAGVNVPIPPPSPRGQLGSGTADTNMKDADNNFDAIDDCFGDIPDPAKRQRINEQFSKLMQRTALQAAQVALQGSDDKWDARINKLVQQQDAKYDAKFEALESKIKKEIEELTSKTAALDAKLSASSNVSNFGGPAVSVASALPSPSMGPAGVTPFVPTKVEVKGWIVPSKGWEQDREEQGLLEVEVGAWLDELFRRLSAEAKECINAEATRAKNRRAISSLVALRLRTDGLDARAAEQRARLVKSAIDQAIAETGDGLKVKGRAPRCTMEAPPWKKPFLNAGGKALGVLQRLGVPAAELKPEWGMPLKIRGQKAGWARPKLLLSFHASSEWAVQEGHLQEFLPTATAASILTELRK
jgi:hypothetical protein